MKNERIPSQIRETIPKLKILADEIRNTFNEDFSSFILFGSALTGDYIPGRSDINSLILVNRYDLGKIRIMNRVIRTLAPPHFDRPALFASEELKNSMEIYPMEFLDIMENHLVLSGEDVFSKVQIQLKNLALACEKELRNWFLELKDSIPGPVFNVSHLRNLLVASYVPFLVIIKNILRVEKRPVPATRTEILQTAAEWLELNPYPFRQILLMKQGILKPRHRLAFEIFSFLFSEVQKLISVVDRWNTRGKK